LTRGYTDYRTLKEAVDQALGGTSDPALQ
jgi:hypothetical protein